MADEWKPPLHVEQPLRGERGTQRSCKGCGEPGLHAADLLDGRVFMCQHHYGLWRTSMSAQRCDITGCDKPYQWSVESGIFVCDHHIASIATRRKQ